MYSIIQSLINHTWIMQNAPGDQSILYYISAAASLILLVCFIDMIYKILGSFIRHTKL